MEMRVRSLSRRVEGGWEVSDEKPRVLNIKDYGNSMDTAHPNSVYVARPTKWGNPFIIGRDGTRSGVIDHYRFRLMSNPVLLAEVRKELRGKNLVCFCAPLSCHADILLEVANND